MLWTKRSCWPAFKRHWGVVYYVHALPPAWSTDYGWMVTGQHSDAGPTFNRHLTFYHILHILISCFLFMALIAFDKIYSTSSHWEILHVNMKRLYSILVWRISYATKLILVSFYLILICFHIDNAILCICEYMYTVHVLHSALGEKNRLPWICPQHWECDSKYGRCCWDLFFPGTSIL